jgi:hypothetical protein
MAIIRMMRSQGVVANDLKYYVVPIIGVAMLTLAVMAALTARI